jgi:hypothetical protein
MKFSRALASCSLIAFALCASASFAAQPAAAH